MEATNNPFIRRSSTDVENHAENVGRNDLIPTTKPVASVASSSINMGTTNSNSIPRSSIMKNQAGSVGSNALIPTTAGSVAKDPPSKDPNVNGLTAAMEDLTLEQEKMKTDWKKEMSEMDAMFLEHARAKLTNIPPHPMPTDILQIITLLPHQEQGVRWMISQELCNDPPPFWILANNKSKWRCKVPGFKWRSTPPDPIRGGVLADGTYHAAADSPGRDLRNA